jgi:dTMP kinase
MVKSSLVRKRIHFYGNEETIRKSVKKEKACVTALFITFEGGEGSGKSVQAKELLRRLSKLGVPALLTHEPGGTSLGEQIAAWLKKSRNIEISPLTELMLFNASRAQLVTEVIKPNLKSGKVVICDRFDDSTTAYQGYGRGLDMAMVKATNKAATQRLKPDLTILMDMPVDKGLARKKGGKDRFEQETLAFHQKVREGYLKLASEEPERWLVVNGTQSREKIADTIWQRVSQLISKRGG